jgi:prolyl 4-hydroxylase
LKNLDQPWKDWVRLNIQRGCSRQELFEILLAEGFDRDGAALEATRRDILIPNLQPVESPLVELYTAENFLSREECAALIELMEGRLRPSTITAKDEPDQYFRRSKTCDLSYIGNPVIQDVDQRICTALRIDPAYAEPTQAQHYDIGDEFKPHTDYFETVELERFSTPTWGQRTWTFMIYLNEPTGGGATAFPSVGLVVRPKTGLAVIWNSLKPDGQPNPHSIHHGTPVTAGWKAIITKWFRAPRT